MDFLFGMSDRRGDMDYFLCGFYLIFGVAVGGFLAFGVILEILYIFTIISEWIDKIRRK